jgi:Mce-associated membrane protein
MPSHPLTMATCPPTRHAVRLGAISRSAAGGFLAVLLACAVTACGPGAKDVETAPDPELGAESTCSEFLAAVQEHRDRALRLLAADLEVPDAVTPAGATQVEYTCAQDPEGALGDAVAALGGGPADASEDASGQAAAVPVADPDAKAAALDGLRLALAYSWDTLEADRAAAESVMTPQYWREAKRAWDVVMENAASQKATVEINVLASGVVQQDPTRGTFLVFVDRPTSKVGAAAEVYKDVVLVTVATDSGGPWLIDDLSTDGLQDTNLPAEGPVAAAEEFIAVVNTYTVSDLEPDGSLDGYNAAIQDLTTADFFATYLENGESTLVALLEQGIEASYDPVAAAASHRDGDTVTVLVAGRRVQSVDGKDQEPQLQRLEVDLVQVDGRWLVQDFAPVTS